MKGLVLTHRRSRRNSGIGGNVSAYRRVGEGRAFTVPRRGRKKARCFGYADTPMRSSLADTPTRRYADTFFTQLSVPQMNPPLRNLRDLAAVCDHNQRRQMLIGNMLENLQHFFRIGTVEVPRRFVGQQQFWSMHKSSRDRRALHLAPAELMHKMVLSFLHSDKTKHLPGTSHGLAKLDPLKL